MLGDDGNQIGAHSALRTPHSALERLFSSIQFGMDDWGIWRLQFIARSKFKLDRLIQFWLCLTARL
jgi:hypothetical protein